MDVDGLMLARTAQAFRDRAARGDLSGGRDLLRALQCNEAGAGARAWQLAVCTRIWLACPDAVSLPSIDDVETLALADGDSRRAASLAASDLALVAFLAFDGAAVERCAVVLAALACDAESELRLAFAHALRALFHGSAPPPDFERLVARAGQAGDAAARAEGQAVRALIALADGDSAGGLELARRASLMARTESLPQAEFLANLVLARARRYNRQGHLALRIIEVLAGVLTPPWFGWLAWESAFADAPQPEPAPGAARSLAQLLEAARAGDRARFDARRSSLAQQLGGGLFGRELRDLAALLAPDAAPAGPDGVAFMHGQINLPPAGLDNLAWRDDAADPEAPRSAAACVLARPGERGVRFLHRGLPLIDRRELTEVSQSRRSQGRVDVLLAVLALEGPTGLDDADCFARVYGFNYVPALHRNVFDVLVHRARLTVDGRARIERDTGRVALEILGAPLVVPDPRICQRTTDRVLRLLATAGQASAREAAGSLKLSLRAVQSALNELAKSQACAVTRDGRRVLYVVEDTVFSTPTQRFRIADLAAPAAQPSASP